MRRRALVGLLALPIAAAASAQHPGLPPARSLPDELAAALQRGLPLVVLVSLEGCPYCKEVRENYLMPMQRAQTLAAVEIDMRSAAPLRDFAGRTVTHEQMARAWRVRTAPTVLFFGGGGREVAGRLVGLSADFYEAYLQERLRQARAGLG